MFHDDSEIEAIAEGLRARTLPKARWTHAAHFAAALWLLRHYDGDVFRDMPELIRAYNAATGGANTDTEGYHETITQASLLAARSFLAARSATSLYECCNELLQSPLGSPSWLLAHWSRARLFSTAARRAWMQPDLQPLAFGLDSVEAQAHEVERSNL